MKIKCSPLLYGRTYKVDFGSQFLVQPDFFTQLDETWAFSIVSSSMDHSDFVRRTGRHVIFGNGRFVVVGLVTNFIELSRRCGRELMPQYRHLDHEKGREPHGFIGVVISVKGTICDITDDAWLDLYNEMIALVWDRDEIGEPVKIAEREIDVEEVNRKLDEKIFEAVSRGIKDMKPVVFKDDIMLYNEVSYCVLSMALKGSKIVFCSNADDIRAEYRNYFNVVTCDNPHRFIPKPRDEVDYPKGETLESYQKDVCGYDHVLMTGNMQRYKTENQKSKDTRKGLKHQSENKKGRVLSYDDILAQGSAENGIEDEGHKKNYFCARSIIKRGNQSVQQDEKE